MKITCDVIQDLMPSYIDGILSEDSRALVEEHMGTCQECRKMLEIMKEEQEKRAGPDKIICSFCSRMWNWWDGKY